ncbi:contact-dependent growth inhibition system immunity protein [Erwinia sp. 198]|uniref:contact-dependent growth inhibition system immunity protein n=1 Tax=Erwinia sp. 198 TaxID=2022746 RepID=UPI001F356FBB|nr:contact-dependent growth inhibition system immunity protein [Erwinia sp. 198]
MFGETTEEILDSYLETENPKAALKVYQETDDLLALNDGALTEAFGAISQGEFCPDSWGKRYDLS